MNEIYQQSFSRNIGIITVEDQQKLSEATIAIAGVGGSGGNVLTILARVGVGGFHIADPEEFDYSNINRQEGATLKTIGKKKVDVLEEFIMSVNKGARVKKFPEGLTYDNVDEFLEGVDVVVDGIDFSGLSFKKKLFDSARQRNLYVFSAPALDFGVSLCVFSPTGPTFDEFFGPIPEQITSEYFINFGLSFFPKIPDYINLDMYLSAVRQKKALPCISPSPTLSGVLVATEIVFFLLGMRQPTVIPKVKYIDLFTQSFQILDSKTK